IAHRVGEDRRSLAAPHGRAAPQLPHPVRAVAPTPRDRADDAPPRRRPGGAGGAAAVLREGRVVPARRSQASELALRRFPRAVLALSASRRPVEEPRARGAGRRRSAPRRGARRPGRGPLSPRPAPRPPWGGGAAGAVSGQTPG